MKTKKGTINSLETSHSLFILTCDKGIKRTMIDRSSYVYVGQYAESMIAEKIFRLITATFAQILCCRAVTHVKEIEEQ